MDEEELGKRTKRINDLCVLIEALGENNNNGNVGEYLSALHICAGRCIWRMPNHMKEPMLQKFFLEVREAARRKV
jgi:hypothetical protein